MTLWLPAHAGHRQSSLVTMSERNQVFYTKFNFEDIEGDQEGKNTR